MSTLRLTADEVKRLAALYDSTGLVLTTDAFGVTIVAASNPNDPPNLSQIETRATWEPVETPPITTPLVIERDQIVHRYFVQVAAFIDTLPSEPTAGDTRAKRLAVAIIRALGAAGIGVRSIEETRS